MTEPAELTKLRAMATLGGTAEGIRTRRGPDRQIIAAFWAPYGVVDSTIWTWTLSEGLVERSYGDWKAWRPSYEPYAFHTDEEWARLDEARPHPNQHIFDVMTRGPSYMAGAPNPLQLLGAARSHR